MEIIAIPPWPTSFTKHHLEIMCIFLKMAFRVGYLRSFWLYFFGFFATFDELFSIKLMHAY